MNIIIFENNKGQKELYVKLVKSFFLSSSLSYKIIENDCFTRETPETINSLVGEKIYIINYDIPGKNGIELAKIIRSSGDTHSPIILLVDKKYAPLSFAKNTLILNIIYKDSNVLYELYESMCSAFQMLTKNEALTFSINDEVFRIPYSDIYCIIKNKNDDLVTIYTYDDEITFYSTIKILNKILENDPRFFKTHRSAIVNLYNILSYDASSNIIVFKNNTSTNLVSRENKKELIERLKQKASSKTLV